jgi:AcrR family transcriptional regulator
MTDHPNPDRRVERTKNLLRTALIQLVMEKGYDAITIQDIADRANVGRTTFYFHYQNKDDLLLDHHADFLAFVEMEKLTREELLGDAPSPGLVRLMNQIITGKNIYLALAQARDARIINRGVQQQMAEILRASLEDAFPDAVPTLPLDVLVNYVIGAQRALMEWWLTTRNTYPPDHMAAMLHQLQRAAVRDAYGMRGK